MTTRHPLQQHLCTIALTLLILITATGCQSGSSNALVRTPLPGYEWVSPAQAVSLMNQRTHSFDNAITTGKITLTQINAASNRPQTLSAEFALVLMGTRHLRLRVWKMNQPIIDVTLNPQGCWVWTADHAPAFQLDQSDIARLVHVLQNKVPQDILVVQDPSHDQSEYITLQEEFPRDGVRSLFTLHKFALIATQYRQGGTDTHPLKTITLSQYDLIDYYPWPMRVTLTSDQGSMQLDFREVIMNTRLPANPFTPYSRATQIQ